MYIIDSCGWLEWFTNGRLADAYKKYLEKSDEILVPAVVLYEVYKILKREVGEEKALLAAGYIKNSEIIPFDDLIAFKTADLALEYGLAMADAQVYATGLLNSCQVITSDSDLMNLPRVKYIPKK